jgi:transposase
MSIACTVTAAQLRELGALLRSRTTPVGHARRVRVIVLTAEGRSGAEIASMVGIAPEVDSRIRRRFVEHGVEGLADQPKTGRKDRAVKPEVVECIVQMALSPPPAGRTRWTTRLIGDEVDLTSATVAKVLRANGLKPHLVRTKSAATPNSQRKSPTLCSTTRRRTARRR